MKSVIWPRLATAKGMIIRLSRSHKAIVRKARRPDAVHIPTRALRLMKILSDWQSIWCLFWNAMLLVCIVSGRKSTAERDQDVHSKNEPEYAPLGRQVNKHWPFEISPPRQELPFNQPRRSETFPGVHAKHDKINLQTTVRYTTFGFENLLPCQWQY